MPNHSTWWDGFFVYILNKIIFKREIYLMMLEDELTRNFFFSRIGAYSIRQGSISGVKESLDYTRSIILNKSSCLICIFPQGELLPWGKMPPGFKRGPEIIFRNVYEPVYCCLLAIKIEFFNEQRPDVYFMFDHFLLNSPNMINMKEYETKMENLLDKLNRAIINQENAIIIFKGKESINRYIEKFRTKKKG
ncbi:lysophospholipid acyltransferase family protein [candidate division KSB1 bacterium]|nr:lysophospholipid acyltransferase family protein [candidate division KSB1 bacterium]